ncbi:MAG TPA: GYD domain-containing protein, partial [Isosphaeraceae bacterium]|nr:GYD domain-containing protein [Isosphaeraceae bacterium]
MHFSYHRAPTGERLENFSRPDLQALPLPCYAYRWADAEAFFQGAPKIAGGRNGIMAHILLQWTYTDPAVQAMLDKPQDRPGELRKVVEAFGGKVHQFFFAFGEHDGLAIV